MSKETKALKEKDSVCENLCVMWDSGLWNHERETTKKIDKNRFKKNKLLLFSNMKKYFVGSNNWASEKVLDVVPSIYSNEWRAEGAFVIFPTQPILSIVRPLV